MAFAGEVAKISLLPALLGQPGGQCGIAVDPLGLLQPGGDQLVFQLALQGNGLGDLIEHGRLGHRQAEALLAQ